MGGSTIVVGWGLGIALLALTALTVAVAAAGRLGVSVVAVGRAVVQLGVVSGVIVAVVDSWPATVAFVALMLGVASWTSGRRMTRDHTGWAAALPILAGTVPALAIVAATGAVPLTGIAVVPVAGIVIGGAMTATSLAGRRALDQLVERRGEYEAALSLGFLDRDAAMGAKPVVPHGMIPFMTLEWSCGGPVGFRKSARACELR